MKTYVIRFTGEVEVEAENEHDALCSGEIPMDAERQCVVGCYDENGEEVEP